MEQSNLKVGLLSWKLVFNGSQKFVSNRRKEDAHKAAEDWGYKFYLWVDDVYWVASDESTGITVDDLF